MCQGFILGAEDTVLSKVDKKLSPSSSEVAFYQLDAHYHICDPGKATRSCSAWGSSQSIRGIK